MIFSRFGKKYSDDFMAVEIKAFQINSQCRILRFSSCSGHFKKKSIGNGIDQRGIVNRLSSKKIIHLRGNQWN